MPKAPPTSLAPPAPPPLTAVRRLVFDEVESRWQQYLPISLPAPGLNTVNPPRIASPFAAATTGSISTRSQHAPSPSSPMPEVLLQAAPPPPRHQPVVLHTSSLQIASVKTPPSKPPALQFLSVKSRYYHSTTNFKSSSFCSAPHVPFVGFESPWTSNVVQRLSQALQILEAQNRAAAYSVGRDCPGKILAHYQTQHAIRFYSSQLAQSGSDGPHS